MMENVSVIGRVATARAIAMTAFAGKAGFVFSWNVTPAPVPFAWQTVLVLLSVGVRQVTRAMRSTPARRVVFNAEFSPQTF